MSLQVQVACYARVSSDQQATAHTIASQVAALHEHIAADGLRVAEECVFIDDGYSGTLLLRPALERLRDLAAAGGIDRLYIHSPDRLARKYAYQVLLVEELRRAGVTVIFLNHPGGHSAEDDLLLQVQGMIAEYERAKILERSRRGKRHAAQAGAVSVLGQAPYGYRYVPKGEGGGQAHFEIALDEARVVRQIFAWIGRDRASIREVCRRLAQAGERTRSGHVTWTPTTMWGMLKNPAYMGRAAFGKTRARATEPRLRPLRGQAGPARRLSTAVAADPTEWISVLVPALVSEDLFLAVQDQLRENQQRRRAQQRGTRYLLQGLVCCACCGYAFYGKAARGKVGQGQGQARTYGYYRCTGTDAHRFGGERQCANAQVRADRLEAAVWAEVCALLQHPQRLANEYHQRLAEAGQAREPGDISTLETQIRAARQGMGRLIDSYAEGLIDKGQFEPRITRLKARVAELDAQRERLQDALGLHHDLQVVVGHLDEFAARVRDHLDDVDWAGRQTIIRTLVKRVDIDEQEVRVVFRVAPEDAAPDPTGGFSPHCTRRGAAPVRGAAHRAERRVARGRPSLHERDITTQNSFPSRGGRAGPVGG